MSKKERIKVTIDILKAIILALMAAFFGIFGYLVVHLYEVSLLQILCAFVGICALLVFFYFVIKYLKRLLDELEALP